MKKFLMVFLGLIFLIPCLADEKDKVEKDWGKSAIQGMVKGIKAPFENMPEAMEIMSNEVMKSDEPVVKRVLIKKVDCDDKGLNCKTSYSNK